MTAAPAVLDKNNDGLADIIYLAETGDYHVANTMAASIWKINCWAIPPTGWRKKFTRPKTGRPFLSRPRWLMTTPTASGDVRHRTPLPAHRGLGRLTPI